MYKVGLALLALVFSVFYLPCLFSFFLFFLAYFFSPSSLKLAVVSHLFTFHNFKANLKITQEKEKYIQMHMLAAKKEGSLRRPKFAVPPHLFKMNQLKAS